MSLPEYINEINYQKSKELFEEANIARRRAEVIYYASVLLGYNDFHGTIEALQHCLELSLKATWVLVGLKYPQNHDPTKDYNKVNDRLRRLFPYLKKEPLFELSEEWFKKISNYGKNLHEKTIYGDEDKEVVASKLFTEDDVGNLFRDVNFAYVYLHALLERIGLLLGLLTENEKKRFEYEKKLSEEIKKHPSITKLIREIVEKQFKSMNRKF